MKYLNKDTLVMVKVISDKAAGMCDKTIGMTMVIYEICGSGLDYPFFMEHREFYKKHTKV